MADFVFNEELLGEEASNSTELEKVIMNIFSECDNDKTGLVEVSKLIEFISPFVDFKSEHLEELRISLDPKLQNPFVSKQVFFKIMKEWTEKCKNDFASSADLTEVTSKRLSDHYMRQSTPTKENIGKENLEAAMMNLSNISSYSYAGSVQGGIDPVALQEQNNELQHQNRKLTDLLCDIRCQLALSEEQNNVLQSDIDRISRRLQAEQKVTDHLHRERRESERDREEAENLMKIKESLEQNLNTCKKENCQLKNRIEDIEQENQKLQETVLSLREKESIKNAIIEELKVEIEVREKDISALIETKKDLTQKCKEKDYNIQQLSNESENLKQENKSLEKRLQEFANRNEAFLSQYKELAAIENPNESGKKPSNKHHTFTKLQSNSPTASTPIPFTPSIDNKKFRFFNYDSPYTRMFNNKGTLNSPRILKMLDNPISPINTNSPIQKSPINLSNDKNCSDEKTCSNIEKSNSLYEGSSTIIENSHQSNPVDISKITSFTEDGKEKSTDCLIKNNNDENQLSSIEIQISPSKIEKGTQTPPFCNKSINNSLSEDLTEPKSVCPTDKNPLNLTSSSLESHMSPTKCLSTSLSPMLSSDEDFYWKSALNIMRPPSPHASLQSELLQASNTECFGSTLTCEHKKRLDQCEEEIENLLYELKQHENCQNINDKFENEVKLREKFKTDLEYLQNEFESVKIELDKRISENEMLKETNSKFEEEQQKLMSVEIENEKLKTSEIILKTKYDSKVQEVNNLRIDINRFKTEIEKYKIEINQHKSLKISSDESLSKAQKDCKKYIEQYETVSKDLEKLKKDLKELETQNNNLLTENSNLVEQVSNYKKDCLNAQQQVKDVKKEMIKSKEDLDSTVKRLENLHKDYEDVTVKCAESQVKFNDTIQKLKLEAETYKNKYQKVKEEMSSLQNENQCIKSDLQQKTNNITVFQAEYDMIKIENAQKEEKLKKLDKLIVEKSGLQEMLENIKMKYKDAKTQIAQIKELRTNYQQSLKIIKEKETAINELEENLAKTISNMDTLIKNHKAETANWAKTEMKLKDKINVLNEDLFCTQQKLEESNTALTKLPKSCEDCNKHQSNISELKQQIENLKSDLNNYECDAKTTLKTDNKKITRIDVLHHRIEKLDAQLFEEKNRTTLLSSNLNSVTLEKLELETKYAEIVKEKHEIATQRELCESKNKRLTHVIEALELKLQNYRKSISDLNEQVVRKNEELAASERKSIDFESKFNTISDKHKFLVAYVNAIKLKIKGRREVLGGVTLCAINIWKAKLETVAPDSPILKLIDVAFPCNQLNDGPLDEEVNILSNQIRLTCILLKSLSKLNDSIASTSGMGDRSPNFSEQPINVRQSDDTNNESLLSKLVDKKFTLKPATLVLKPVTPKSSSMSPDSPAAELAETPSCVSDKIMYAPLGTELNNNDLPLNGEEVKGNEDRKLEEDGKKNTFSSDVSDSGSTSDSGSSESLGVNIPIRRTGDNVYRLSAGESKINHDDEIKEGLTRQIRSMSEGAVVTHHLSSDGDVSVFPNLRDNVLETMGLHPDGQDKERLTDEEIETKFQTLTLAFAIDAVTLQDRRERQRRQRDQAEDNMAAEVERLANHVHRLHPLCVDAETTELVTGLLSHLDIIIKASNRISTSAEVFGSVQQEWRLAESVNLMLSHLRNLRSQRDTALRQLQCTKRMLQDSTEPGTRQTTKTSNGRIPNRRNSLADIPRPLDSPRIASTGLLEGAPLSANRRSALRRISAAVPGEHSPRLWDSRHRPEWSPLSEHRPLVRSSRPNPFELVKIKEGATEPSLSEDSDIESVEFKTPTMIPDNTSLENDIILYQPTLIKNRLARKFTQLGNYIKSFWNYLVEEGTVHEICCLGAILCFALCTITMGNLMLEMEYAKRGISVQKIPWAWITWDELFSIFVNVERTDETVPI